MPALFSSLEGCQLLDYMIQTFSYVNLEIMVTP